MHCGGINRVFSSSHVKIISIRHCGISYEKQRGLKSKLNIISLKSERCVFLGTWRINISCLGIVPGDRFMYRID